jgi:hypothetical protein
MRISDARVMSSGINNRIAARCLASNAILIYRRDKAPEASAGWTVIFKLV